MVASLNTVRMVWLVRLQSQDETLSARQVGSPSNCLLGTQARREGLVVALCSERPPDWGFTSVAVKSQASLIDIISFYYCKIWVPICGFFPPFLNDKPHYLSCCLVISIRYQRSSEKTCRGVPVLCSLGPRPGAAQELSLPWTSGGLAMTDMLTETARHRNGTLRGLAQPSTQDL